MQTLGRVAVLSATFVVWSLAPRAAHAADSPQDAAGQAFDIIEEHCAYVTTGNINVAAGAVSKVADVWSRVSLSYEESKAGYLLYWRGQLAMCLSREEQARADLQAFLDDPASAPFQDQLQRARAALRRLGVKVRVGKGPSARWIRHSPARTFGLRVGGGGGAHLLSCTDADVVDDVPRVENGGCLGGRVHWSPTVPVLRAVHLDADATIALHSNVALGGRVVFDLPVALADSDDPATPPPPAPAALIEIGPRFRGARPWSAKDHAPTAGLWVEPRFVMGLSGIAPWAGTSKYTTHMGS